MIYSFDNFNKIKVYHRQFCCAVGMFGNDIYAALYYQQGSCGSEYWLDFYRISKDEFDDYPNNASELSRKINDNHKEFLCSNYNGKDGRAYRFEYIDGEINVL